ncbi:MAG: large-conductance mechanosensitive channel protein MscL [Bacteroides sp.]
MSWIQEFKAFAIRGNVMDMAVGVIIGGAFGKIVTSLVSDVIMPFIGIFTGGINFAGLTATIGEAEIKYGQFIQNILDFLIIAVCIFLIIKAMNSLKKEKETTPVEPEIKEPSNEEKLLTEIRDLLKNNNLR